jgi:prolyl 4-hydroxylase
MAMQEAIMKAMDLRGADWRDWILTNLAAGCAPGDMRDSMTAAGWPEALADQALAEAALPSTQAAVPMRRPTLPALGDLDLDGHQIHVTMRLAQPGIAICENVLSEQECRQLLTYAQECGLQPSTVVEEQAGLAVSHPERTSAGVMFSRGQTALIARVEARLARLTQWAAERGEGLQILHYAPGQEYRPHFDAFPKGPAGDRHMANGGQRVSTVLVYLRSPEAGGATWFPNLGLTLRPQPGTAIMFHNVDHRGERATLALHAGEPVEKGDKVVLTYWQREGLSG